MLVIIFSLLDGKRPVDNQVVQVPQSRDGPEPDRIDKVVIEGIISDMHSYNLPEHHDVVDIGFRCG